MEFHVRLKQLREEKGLSQRELAGLINIGASTLAMYETARREPDFDTLQKLANFFNVTTDYLLGKSDFRDPLPSSAWPLGPQVRIPVLGVIRAGAPILTDEHIEGYELIDADMVKNGEYFYLRVTGNSMAPKIQDGYKVLVRKQSDVDNEEVAVVIIDNENATLKRVYKEHGKLILRPDNPDYPPIIVDKGNVKIIGKVIYFIGKP